MGHTALQILAEAYRQEKLDDVTSFVTTQEFPFNIALDILNQVIREINRVGNLSFMETKTALTYASAVYQYSMTTYAIDHARIRFIRREATDYWGELAVYNERKFLQTFRMSAIQTAQPTAWVAMGDNIELSTIPDQDYSLYVYHWKDLPLVAVTTDTFLVPERDEDVLINACRDLLRARLGRITEEEALMLIKARMAPFVVSQQNNTAMPLQFPACF